MNEWTTKKSLSFPVVCFWQESPPPRITKHLWRMSLRKPASRALHPHRELTSHYQVQGLEPEEDTSISEHSIYNLDEFYTLLQFLNVTNSEFFTQPKSSMFHPLSSSPYLLLNSLLPTPVTPLWSLKPKPASTIPTVSCLDWLYQCYPHSVLPLGPSSSHLYQKLISLVCNHYYNHSNPQYLMGWSGYNIGCKLS